MYLNHTTPHISTPSSKPEFPGYYALIPFVLLIIIGCMVALVAYIRRKSRIDDLRHRLIPLYNYDPAEEQDNWGDGSREDKDEELTEPLCKDAQLTFTSGYGI